MESHYVTDSLASISALNNNVYIKTIILGTSTTIQFRQTKDDTQSFLLAGCGSATKTILAIGTRYRQSSSTDPTINLTSLGQINVSASTSSGIEKYLQMTTGAYFQGFAISNASFTISVW